MDRVALVLEPALPAKCSVCGFSANGRKVFADFNVSLDYYGAVLICEDCIRETSRALEFSATGELEDALQETRTKLEVAQNELARYQFVVSSLSFVRPDIGVPLNLTLSESIEGTESESNEESTEFVESDSSRGLKSVPEPPD